MGYRSSMGVTYKHLLYVVYLDEYGWEIDKVLVRRTESSMEVNKQILEAYKKIVICAADLQGFAYRDIRVMERHVWGFKHPKENVATKEKCMVMARQEFRNKTKIEYRYYVIKQVEETT